MLIGPSGCGNSTLLRTVNRLVTATAGRITLDGVDTATLEPTALRRSIGYAIQAVGLFPHMTVARNVAVVPELLEWPSGQIAARVDELLTLVDLDPQRYRGRFPRDLSGGEAQRVGVARAIAARPRALLMDEPLFVTHDVDEALRLADRLVVMRAGKIVREGHPVDVLADPQDDYVRDLFGDEELRAFRLLRARRARPA